MSVGELLHVIMNGHIIGDLQRTGRRSMRLRYAPEVLGQSTPLSVSMPTSTSRHREQVIEPWLAGLLPDRPETIRQWRRQFGVTDESVFALLGYVGEDVAGAAQFVRPDRVEEVLQAPGALAPLSASAIGEMLRRVLVDLPMTPSDQMGKFSLAGAQAKIALHRHGETWSNPAGSTPSTHILKPAIPGLVDQDLIEAVTMRTASRLGLRVADCRIEEFGDERALVVTRFDRLDRGRGAWVRIHSEDMCQGLGVWPFRKYQAQGGPGIAPIADLIHRRSDQPSNDVEQFAKALIFNWLVCGTDAHARNYSLLLSGPQVRLAPLYDLNSSLAYFDGTENKLSMSIDGTFTASHISIDSWIGYAPAMLVGTEWLRAEIERQRRTVLEMFARSAADPDIARYRSVAVDRLVLNMDSWLRRSR